MTIEALEVFISRLRRDGDLSKRQIARKQRVNCTMALDARLMFTCKQWKPPETCVGGSRASCEKSHDEIGRLIDQFR